MALHEFTRQTHYGDPAAPTHWALMSPHGERCDLFFEVYPHLREHLRMTDDQLATYDQIEFDFAATSLAHSIAQQVVEIAPVRVTVHEILLPRGFVDANRIPEYAIRRVFPHDIPEGDRQLMYDLHRVNALEGMEKLLRGADYFLNVHTMADCNRLYPVMETPEVEDYILSYNDPALQIRSPKRQFQFVCGNPLKEYGDRLLMKCFETVFKREGYRFEYNNPYQVTPHVTLKQYFDWSNGTSFDVPKSHLATDENEIILTRLEESPSRIRRIGKMFADVCRLRTAMCNEQGQC